MVFHVTNSSLVDIIVEASGLCMNCYLKCAKWITHIVGAEAHYLEK